MVSKRTKADQTQKITVNTEKESKDEGENDDVSGYEQSRDQRIKENLQRMQKLGIAELSRKLKSDSLSTKRLTRIPSDKKPPLLLSGPPRRSSRLESVTPIRYTEIREPKKKKSAEDTEIRIPEGSKTEFYTEEHDKLLGDCNTGWELCVDGYGEDRKSIYDPVEGKTCHQCRQKTLGQHTQCSQCNLVQGQFCGDCLFMRYGENVIEANQNASWICPTCRGICNCSLCRKAKGWEPTGSIYRKVLRLGYKSVAHYLIQTKRMQTNQIGDTSGSADDTNATRVKDIDICADDVSDSADDDDSLNEV